MYFELAVVPRSGVAPGPDLHDLSFSNLFAYEATIYAAPFIENTNDNLSLDNQGSFRNDGGKKQKLTKLDEQANNHADDERPF